MLWSRALTTTTAMRTRWLFASVLVAIVAVVLVDGMRIEQLVEIHKDATSITLEWRTGGGGSQSSAESDWVGFKIKYFTDKLHYPPVLLKNLNLRKFRLDNLKSNTEYRIQVSAYSARETEGPASDLLVVRTSEAGLLSIFTFYFFCFSLHSKSSFTTIYFCLLSGLD